MAECVKCGARASVVLGHISACTRCFSEVFEKRVRKEIRMGKLISKGDSILIIRDRSAQGEINSRLLEKIVLPMPVKLAIRSCSYSLGKSVVWSGNKVVLPWDQDMEIEYFLSCFFKGIKPGFLGHFMLGKKQYIKPLLFMTSEECREYAGILGCRFRQGRTSDILEMMDILKMNHAEIPFNANKNIQKLKYLYCIPKKHAKNNKQ